MKMVRILPAVASSVQKRGEYSDWNPLYMVLFHAGTVSSVHNTFLVKIYHSSLHQFPDCYVK